jgi:hypothetical protein
MSKELSVVEESVKEVLIDLMSERVMSMYVGVQAIGSHICPYFHHL